MALLSSLRNRIFLAGALVSVLSVAVAIQVVTRRVSSAAEAELRRGLFVKVAYQRNWREGSPFGRHGFPAAQVLWRF